MVARIIGTLYKNDAVSLVFVELAIKINALFMVVGSICDRMQLLEYWK